jgi:hypothetical protein
MMRRHGRRARGQRHATCDGHRHRTSRLRNVGEQSRHARRQPHALRARLLREKQNDRRDDRLQSLSKNEHDSLMTRVHRRRRLMLFSSDLLNGFSFDVNSLDERPLFRRECWDDLAQRFACRNALGMTRCRKQLIKFRFRGTPAKKPPMFGLAVAQCGKLSQFAHPRDKPFSARGPFRFGLA